MNERQKRKMQRMKTSNMLDINPIISIITVNLNGLNTPNEKQRLPH
jgi:hypothetical protein